MYIDALETLSHYTCNGKALLNLGCVAELFKKRHTYTAT